MSSFHQSAQKVIHGDLPTVRKAIMIGLGGSGMKGIGSAKSYIEKNMPTEARRYMRWVGIDTTDIGTSIEAEGGRYRFPGEKQFFQEDTRSLYIGAPTPSELSLEYLRNLKKNKPEYAWLPDPDVYPISTRAGQGANQTRPLGRLAFYHNYEKIRTALIAERDRLMALSNDPRYFRLLDVQEKSQVETTDRVIRLESGRNRYYIDDQIPGHHELVALELDEGARLLLCPNIPREQVTPNVFPRDDRGRYFEISPERSSLKEIRFRLQHSPREGAVSIFLTGSVVGGTGNGMFIDAAALIHDIFRDVWPAPKIYGIIVLPSAFKRVVYNRNARANAYAALKEIDYFMSGNSFRAIYPGGHETVVHDRLFEDGMLYVLDVENLSGNVLQGRDQVQELTGQFIYTFVASSVGGAIEERMVNDSSRTSVYVPEKGDEPRRRASYNSFGISRVTYPAPMLRDLGYKLVSLKIINQFRRPVNAKLLNDTYGDLNRGMVRALRLNCLLLFERMYPDHLLDWEGEFNSYKVKIKKALAKKDSRELVSALEVMERDYGRGEMDRLRDRLLKRMEGRRRIELDKMEQVLHLAIEKITKDPSRGFLFCRALLERVMEQLELYQGVYYEKRVALEYYSSTEIEQLIADLDGGEWKPKKADAVFYMVRINYLQLIYEAMLQAAEEFVREFKSLIYRIKNDVLSPLEEKLKTLARDLQGEIQKGHFELLQKVNPLFFYLINKNEIQNFVNEYFAKRLSVEDLCSDVDFLALDRGDDTHQLIETYLLGRKGLEILELSASELDELIVQEFGAEILSQSPEEVKERLFGEGQDEAELVISDAALTRIEVENLRGGLYKVIHRRFEGFNFENISIKKMLDEKKIPVKRVLERLDTFSRSYTTADLRGLKSMEYFRTITQFPLNVFEEGDSAPESSDNDLPRRMDHYAKRAQAEPNISVETFQVPSLCKPYEIISIGVTLGIPLFRVDGLRESAVDYHDILGDRSHPMHLFNDPSFDARYFPDPFRDRNYLNPRRLWEGLKHFGMLAPNARGHLAYEESLHEDLRVLVARENYHDTLKRIIERVEASGGIKLCPLQLYTKVILSLGMLKRNTRSGVYSFRRDYDLVIRDILDGDGTGDRAREKGISKAEYLESGVESPEFTNMEDLADFLQETPACRAFLDRDIERVFHSTMGHVSAGADIEIPESRVSDTALPTFEDEFAFYDYFERHGSLEWQNLLKSRLVEAVEKQVRKFRHVDDPSLLDRRKIGAYLEELGNKLPFIVAWEVQVNTGVIK